MLQTINVHSSNGGKAFATPGSSSSIDPVRYLVSHGYTQWTSYQPASRYWTFQWIEFGWLFALSALLLTASLWWVRRR